MVVLEVNGHVTSSDLHPGILPRQFEDYITDDELAAMEQDVLYFSRAWYRADGHDVTWFDGVSFGEAMELEFLEFFALLLTGLTYAFRAITAERPDEVLVFHDGCFLQNIFLYVCSTQFPDIPVTLLETSKRHRDYIEAQNPDFFIPSASPAAPVKSESKSGNLWRGIVHWLAILWKKIRIEADDVIFTVFRTRRIPPTLFILSDVRHFDLASRLKHTRSYRILSDIHFSQSDYKYLARAQAEASQTFTARWEQIDRQSALHTFFRYNPSCPGTSRSVSLGESSADGFLNLWDFVAPHIRNTLSFHIALLVEWIHVFRRWAQREHLSLIVLDIPYTIPHRRAWVLAARKLRIPTVALLEGPFHPMASNGNAFITPITDHIATWGEASTQMAYAQGYQHGQVHVIGEHHLEELAHEVQRTDTVALKQESGIDLRKKVMTYTPTGVPAWTAWPVVTMLDKQDILHAVCKASQRLPQHHFIIKFHPTTDLFEGDGALSSKVDLVTSYQLDNMTVMTSRKKSIANVFSMSDLVVAIDGTTGLEAIYFGKPLIVLNFRNRQRLAVEFIQYGAAIGVYEPDEFPDAIQRIFTDEEVRERLRQGRKRFLDHYITHVPDYHTIIENLARRPDHDDVKGE